jgi:hypothetical protein
LRRSFFKTRTGITVNQTDDVRRQMVSCEEAPMFGRKNKTDDDTLSCSFCGKGRAAVRKLIAAPNAWICDECIGLCVDILHKEDASESRAEPAALPTASAVAFALRARCVAPDAVVDLLSRALTIPAPNEGRAPRILIVGPLGCGKTTVAQALAPASTRAGYCVDLNRITATGYVGEDVENAAHGLFMAAGEDMAQAERGVLVFDGLQHVRDQVGDATGRDVGTRAVQPHLLRVLGGEALEVMSGPRHPQRAGSLMQTRGVCVVLTMTLDAPGDDPRAIRDRLRAMGVLGELLARVDLIVPLPMPDADQMAVVVDQMLRRRAPGLTLAPADRWALAEDAAQHPDGGWRIARGLMQRALGARE